MISRSWKEAAEHRKVSPSMCQIHSVNEFVGALLSGMSIFIQEKGIITRQNFRNAKELSQRCDNESL
jgi:hypothetical protein